MLKDARKMLDQLDLFLCRGDQAAKDVADMLSAIRGEDAEVEGSLKKSGTCPLRSAMFPRLYKKCCGNVLDLGVAAYLRPPATPDTYGRFRLHGDVGWGLHDPATLDISDIHFDDRDHFSTHLRNAVKALKREESDG